MTADSVNEALISTALGEIGSIRTTLPETFDPLKPFVAKFISSNLERLGIDRRDNDSIDDELLRPLIISSASYAGNQDIIDVLLRMFDAAKTPEDIRSDIRGTVYSTAVRERNDSVTRDTLLTWYKTTQIPGENITLASAITGFKSTELVKKNLALVTSETVRLQDALYWIAYSLLNRHQKTLAWSWLKENWDWVSDNFGKDKEIDYFLRFSARGFATKEHLNDYMEFFQSHNIHGSDRAFEQGKETIAWESAWRARDTEAIITWLSKN